MSNAYGILDPGPGSLSRRVGSLGRRGYAASIDRPCSKLKKGNIGSRLDCI